MKTASRQPIRMLIVDDEQPVREAYAEILSDPVASADRNERLDMRARLFRKAGTVRAVQASSATGFDPVFCDGAEAAVEAVREAFAEGRPFAVVFLDMRMPPGPDGLWAAERIRALDPEVEIVICTAFSDADPRQISRRVPPEDKLFYLQKPFHPHEVRQIAVALGLKWSAERHITRLAYYDVLTGLPNRAHFHEQLSVALETAQQQRAQLAVIYLDLDNFKRINDTLGHGVGDELLKLMAQRLTEACSEGEGDEPEDHHSQTAVARLGGDEFVVVLNDIDGPDEACGVAERVINALSQPMRLSAHEILVTPSAGIALYPADGADVDLLCRNADLAMYFSKRQGAGQYALYQETMNARGLQRLTIEAQLRNALARKELSLHYQPEVHLGSGRVAGLEALLRWTNVQLGSVPPIDFIPIAEETGLILPIGEWVLRTACVQAKAWHDEGLQAGRIAVNVSSTQLAQRHFGSMVAAVLRETGLPPELLELEITESLVMQDDARTERLFAELKTIGVSIAIDDFGTGYSNFGRLRELSVDRLKIDRSFIHRMHTDPEDRALVSAMIKMAQTIGIAVIAEGVEDFSQLLQLQDERCDQAQGYLLSRPLPVAEARVFLKRITDIQETSRTLRLRKIAQ
ncbi:MAG TPA: EAL domain-containing protein [Steroidobacteraceae bacterium]|nr:EAL domain-containing protein [Steroidobacteraceae bacterium]